MLQTGTFWLALLVLCAMLCIKDVAVAAAYREFAQDRRLVLQEVGPLLRTCYYMLYCAL
jgi:hypothetical protein